MTQYLKEQASLPFVMMRETAGIQVSVDYIDEEDAINKFSCALKLAPFLTFFISFMLKPICLKDTILVNSKSLFAS